MKRVLHKTSLHDPEASARDLAYWLSRPLSERIEAVEALRVQSYGILPPMPRIARVIKRSNKRTSGLRKDLADLEALDEK
jgi:hypothetical protein